MYSVLQTANKSWLLSIQVILLLHTQQKSENLSTSNLLIKETSQEWLALFCFLKEQKFLSLKHKQTQIKDKKKLNEKFCPERLHSFVRLVKATSSKYITTVNSTSNASSALFSEVWRDQLFATIRAAAVTFLWSSVYLSITAEVRRGKVNAWTHGNKRKPWTCTCFFSKHARNTTAFKSQSNFVQVMFGVFLLDYPDEHLFWLVLQLGFIARKTTHRCAHSLNG